MRNLLEAEDLTALDGSKPALRPCRYCGGLWGRLQPAKPPHGQGVRCAECERHLGWLPKTSDETDDFDLFER